MSRFQSSIQRSSSANCFFTPVNPASSHSQKVAMPMTVSRQARKVKGSKASIRVSLIFLISIRKSSSVTSGSNISGYRLANVGARSPLVIQSRFMRMIRVVLYSSESSGTCGFGWGKQGCEGPHGNSDAASASSSPADPDRREPSEVRRELGRETRDSMPGCCCCCSCRCWWLRPASMSLSTCGAGDTLSLGFAPEAMAGPGVGGWDSCWLLRSRGRAMLVRPLMLSSHVERWTARELGTGLWRLRRCSGRDSRGYSSRPSSLAPTSLSMGRFG
ncbi:hypothetical protein IG631_11881 [Alternaria alternata]|nr:hypothetical protein IG631_11881 [Alternaria alternata]